MATQFLSPKDLAAAIGVSESSLKRWIDSGRLEVQRTAGGHRRIPIEEAVRFVRAEGYQVQDPTCFGVACCGQVDASHELNEAVFTALQAGEADRCQSLIITAYLGGMSVPALCDGPLTNALRRLGELWKHGDDGIAIEHAATGIVVQVLEYLRQHLKRVPDNGPVALGGGICNHHCLVPTLMVGITLQEAGFRSVNLGPHTPDGALSAAIERHKPDLVWRSVSSVEDPEQAADELCSLASHIAPVPLVVGGREVHRLRLNCSSQVHVINSMGELGAFAKAIALAKTTQPS